MNSTANLEVELRDLILKAVQALPRSGDSQDLPAVVLEIPKIRSHGDLATSVALHLASLRKASPFSIGRSIAQHLETFLSGSSLKPSIERVEVRPPGFINFFLSPAFFHSLLEEILRSDSGYGRCSLGDGKKALVEFVSANPTGPLSVAHGRQAAVGDALANLLGFAGYQVSREYYLNDEGTQIDLLGASILARAREEAGLPSEFPENGYKGEYVRALGKNLAAQKGPAGLEGPKAQEAARDFGVKELTQVIHGELERFGVLFEEWFPQSSLRQLDYLDRTLNLLKERGSLYESEGAWWLKSTAFGDDKDRVVIRSDGRLTYIAADIAYHRRKFERGFHLLINLWGPDHHGYIARLKAGVDALGFSSEALQIRIVQLCTLKRANQVIPMSTREGQFITLTEVMQEVGRDAARFFFLLRKTDAHLEFDLELAKQQSLENPVYYIQYAYARICSLLKYDDEQKNPHVIPRDFSRLTAPEELALLRILREFPRTVEMSAKALEPFGVTAYLRELAEGFHRFYDAHRVVGPDPELTAARLSLVKGVRIVLATGLKLLGISAPEKM